MEQNQKNCSREEVQYPSKFESDTKKVVHRHLQDKNHVITEEELRSIRIGQTPPQSAKDISIELKEQ